MKRTPKMIVPLRLTIVAFCLVGGLFSSCNQPFDPRGDLDERPVVFSVLATNRNLQFVRVERSYMPAGYDVLAYDADNFIPNAVVTVSNGSLTMRLRDTTLPRSDTSRFNFPLRAYVVSPFKPLYGGSYNVRVEAAGFEPASGSIVVPMKPYLDIDPMSRSVLDRPGGYIRDVNIVLPMILGKGAFGYRVRLYVDYEVLKGSEWIEERVEIPSAFALAGSSDLSYVVYPKFTRSPSNNRAVGVHNHDVYSRTLVEVAYMKYGSTKIVFNRIVVQLIQLDRNLFGYYISTHTQYDPHSIRLDEPAFFPVAGGFGAIGAYTLDSLVHILPESFPYSRY
ncbi:MAG: DUF4249 family protein [Ignavibacteria bacterium]|nr:DUF4249 family protein [Ignavibacteria bacterium]